jgi:NAD(P)-dependent dehydrogenase (short-subunit alcohol dehydrogenase family)
MKTALITGGGAGIGQAIAYELACHGYTVIVADKSLERAERTTEEICKQGGSAVPVYVDISDERAVVDMFGQVQSFTRADGLHVLVNNAGINMMKSVEQTTVDFFDACISVNLRGHFLCSKYAIPYLKQAGQASIVNVSSTRAFSASANGFPYNVCKAGLLALNQSLAVELGAYQIRVNAVCPGLVKTSIEGPEFWDESTPHMKTALELQPMGKIGEPAEIAKTVAFLVSDQASFINGEFLVADGGRNALKYYFGC